MPLFRLSPSSVTALLSSLAAAAFLLLIAPVSLMAQEPLSSWNDTDAKSKIMAFVEEATREGGERYIDPVDRIAVFDNDGTLWSEQPYYFQLAFALDRVKTLAAQHPQWREEEPFKSILADELSKLAQVDERGLVELVTATHAGLTTDQFNKIVTDWFSKARHPKTGRPFTQMTFLPMRELLDYLRANDFRTYIVSGGGIEFMRPIAEEAYGIPPEQIIGSTIKTEYALVGDVPVLRRLPEIDFINDGPGKPVGIDKFIGRRPVFVAGNSDGDYEMLRWTTAGSQPSFAMIVHHTDSEREFAYDRDSPFGRLDKALDEAERRNWVVVDMKADWNQVYADEQ